MSGLPDYHLIWEDPQYCTKILQTHSLKSVRHSTPPLPFAKSAKINSVSECSPSGNDDGGRIGALDDDDDDHSVHANRAALSRVENRNTKKRTTEKRI